MVDGCLRGFTTGIAGPLLLAGTYHIVDGGFDILVCQIATPTPRRHKTCAALKSLDRMLNEDIHALADPRGPCRFVPKLWSPSRTWRMAYKTGRLIDCLTFIASILRRYLSGCGRGLFCNRGGWITALTHIHLAHRCN